MKTAASSNETVGAAVAWQSMVRKVLLVCWILSSLVYIAMNILAAC